MCSSDLVAATEQSLLDGSQSALPCLDLRIGCAAMLEKRQRAPFLQDPVHLGKGLADVGNGAQGHRAQHVIDRFVGQVDIGPIESEVINLDAAPFDPRRGQLATDRRRVDGNEAIDRRGKMRNIQARSEPDFENRSGEVPTHFLTQS